MTNKEAIQILRCSGYTSNPIEIDEAIELACKALEERPTGQVNCSHCDYLNFSKKIINIIVEVMTKYGIESVEDLQRELDRCASKNQDDDKAESGLLED